MPKASGTSWLLLLAGLVGSLIWSPSASALTITIGAQASGVNGNAVTLMASGDGQTACAGACSYGGANEFKFDQLTATGIPVFDPNFTSELLSSTSMNVTAKNFAGTIYVYVVEQGLSGSGTFDFSSGFTAQFGPNTVVEQTWMDPTNGTGANGLYASTGLGTIAGYVTKLGDSTLVGLNSSPALALLVPVSTPYSVIELFKVSLQKNSSANSSISLFGNCDPCNITSETPLPAALPLFGGVLGGGFLFRKLRNRRKA